MGNSKLEITKERNGGELAVSLAGRLDTNTAPELQAVFDTELSEVSQVQIDMEKLEYLSSAGLRTLLTGTRKMDGNLTVFHVNDEIMEVFKITGFDSILNIR